VIGTAADPRPGTQAAPSSVIAAFGLAAAAAVLLYETLAASDQPARAVLWGGLALATYAAVLLFLTGTRQGRALGLGAWRLGPWMLLSYGVTFGLATMTLSSPQTAARNTFAQITLPSVLRALLLVAFGMTVWAVGYQVGPGKPARERVARAAGALSRRFTPEVRSLAAPWVLYLGGTAARLASAATTGRFGYVGDAAPAVSTATWYGQLLSLLGLCAPLAVAVAGLQTFRERLPGARPALVVFCLAELVVGAAQGDKVNFVVTVLAVVVPYTAQRRRLPIAAMTLTLLVFLMIVVPFTAAYRAAARGGPATMTSGQAISAAPGIFRQTVTHHNIVTAVPGSTAYLLGRIREIDAPAIILQRTPQQIGYLSGAQLLEGPALGVIPRAIWPSKPIQATGYELNVDYYGLPSNLYTSAAITPVGDLYRHGGWVPVAVGMFLLGCGVRLFDVSFDVRENAHAVLLVPLLFPSLVLGEEDWVTLLTSIPGTLLIWMLAVRLVFRRRRPT
jgi:hypothetical protein